MVEYLTSRPKALGSMPKPAKTKTTHDNIIYGTFNRLSTHELILYRQIFIPQMRMAAKTYIGKKSRAGGSVFTNCHTLPIETGSTALG